MESYKIGMSYPNKRVMNNSGGQVPVTKTGKNPPQSTEEGVAPLVRDVPGCTLGPLFGYLPSHMKIPVQQNYLFISKIVLRDRYCLYLTSKKGKPRS